MAGSSKIEWTEATWNPIVGCSILSPGCANCYAMKMAGRIEAMKSSHYDGTTKKTKAGSVWTGKLALAPERILLEPLRRKKPTTYFVNSMGDLFHESVPDEWIDRVFAVMALAPQHTFQVLTKRAERMRGYITNRRIAEINWAMQATSKHAMFSWPLPNVWLGVSTERQQEADERIPHLLATPAAVRFISAEPLLGPIDLMGLVGRPGCETITDALQGCVGYNAGPDEDGRVMWEGAQPCAKLDWVIVGGESGPGARPMHPDWARSLRDQCASTGTAFFFKQWGEWGPIEEPASEEQEDRELRGYPDDHIWSDGTFVRRLGKKSAGRLLDGVEHNAMPGRAD